MYQGKLAILQSDDLERSQQLAVKLSVPLYKNVAKHTTEDFFLTWRDGCLKLLDKAMLKKGGLMVNIFPRPGEQCSWPATKVGALSQAIGKKTKTVVDATTGWAQDSLHIFRMGYDIACIERSPIMLVLLEDAFQRLEQLDWMQGLQLSSPRLLAGNAIELLAHLDYQPDCIYIDPMFPAKRKKSALPKKSMVILRDLLGDDLDSDLLFAVALAATGKKVVVKMPEYADFLTLKPVESFGSKLLRYDVYLKR